MWREPVGSMLEGESGETKQRLGYPERTTAIWAQPIFPLVAPAKSLRASEGFILDDECGWEPVGCPTHKTSPFSRGGVWSVDHDEEKCFLIKTKNGSAGTLFERSPDA